MPKQTQTLPCVQVDGVYDCDPVKNPDAKLHRRLSFRQVRTGLNVVLGVVRTGPECCVGGVGHTRGCGRLLRLHAARAPASLRPARQVA